MPSRKPPRVPTPVEPQQAPPVQYVHELQIQWMGDGLGGAELLQANRAVRTLVTHVHKPPDLTVDEDVRPPGLTFTWSAPTPLEAKTVLHSLVTTVPNIRIVLAIFGPEDDPVQLIFEPVSPTKPKRAPRSQQPGKPR